MHDFRMAHRFYWRRRRHTHDAVLAAAGDQSYSREGNAGAVAAGETYLPEGVTAQRWYQPTDRGAEARIAQRLEELRRLNASK